ncbi:MAG: T9SS type A sorting domain-containing protein [Candidatus Kapaibacterium sp.]
MIIALAVFAIMSNYAFASTWYVDQATGNDADNGTTPALAKQTIQAMVGSASVVNGDIVIVGNGTYVEQVRILNKGITLRSENGASVTTIKAPTYLSLTSYTEAGNLAWNDAIQGAGKALPSDVVMPVLFLDCPNTGYTNNVYGFTIDGDNQAQIAPAAGAEKSLVGILVKYTAGTIGGNGANEACIIKNCQTNGATPWLNDDRNGYGIMVIGNSNCTIKYCTITTYQSAGIAVIGKNTTAGAATQNPIPNIFDNSIRGSDANPGAVARANDGWYTGILVSYGGRGTIRRNILSDHYNSNGTNAATNVLGVGAGIYLIDVRTITIGSTSTKTDGNVSANNEYGLMVNVTNGAIPVTSLTIQRNNFVYNGNVGDDKRQDVRYVNTGTAASSSLNMSNNAFGNSEANSGGAANYTLGTAATDAFIADAGGNDFITYTSVLAPTKVDVNCTYTLYNTGVEWGYSKVNTIQRGVNSVATGFTNAVVVSDCATNFQENVVIKKTLQLVGDSVATCANRPTINPSSGYAVTIQSPVGGPSVDEVVVNGFHFLQAGAQRAGLLVIGVDGTNMATNYPPIGTKLRNNCWEGYGAQTLEGDGNGGGSFGTSYAPDAASIATSNIPWGGAEHSWDISGVVGDNQNSDIDAQANNNFNYNGAAALPTFKVWDEADGFAVAMQDARILFNNLIIVHCGESINTAIAAVSGGGTIYIEGNCVYTEDVVVDKAITFRTIFDGLPLPKYPPVIQGINRPMTFSNGAAGSACGTTFATGSANTDTVYFWNPSTITTAAPTVYTTNDGAALATGQFFTGGFKGMRRPTQLRVIYGMGDGGCIQDAVDLIYNNCELNIGAAATQVPATSGIIHIEGGTYVQDVIVEKTLTFNASNGSPVLNAGQSITLNNAAANTSATDCQTVVNSTLNGGTTRFQAPTVYVNADQTDIAAATDRATVDMGILLVAPNGTVTIDAAGTFTENRATINKNNVTLNTSIATTKRTLDAITLNGSGACGGTASDIVDILVDTVFIASNVDCIQTALGNTAGNQDDEGVGNAVSGGNRQGTIAFTYGGATSVAQALTVDKDVRFSGNVTPNTNSGSLTMRLGARGIMIDTSSNFCNTTVNATQVAGSGFTQIPDIQTGILLACATGTLNVGTTGAATTWGGGTDLYNKDNTITKSLTVQGTNTTNTCANTTNGGGFYIDAATAWTANGSRSAFTTTFSTFTAANPIFQLDSAVNTVTIQGFDFTNITDGAANGIIYSRKGNNTITIKGNVVSGTTTERFVHVDSLTTARTNWLVDCNRVTSGAAATPTFAYRMNDINGLTISNNNTAYTAATSGAEMFVLGGISNLAFTDNVVEGSRRNGLYIHRDNSGNVSKNTPGGTNTILRNRFRGNNTAVLSNSGGIAIENANVFTGTWTIANNFINNNSYAGLTFAPVAATTIPSINTFLINNNSITGNSTRGIEYNGLSTSGPNANCGINARGNWWNNASGPTSLYNPLNLTPCTATAYGDAVQQNAALTCPDSVTRVSFVPWWTDGTDANATQNGWQEPAAPANVLGRVVRTNSAGAWQASYATISLGTAAATANDKIFVIQGLPSWTPAPGPNAASGPWGAYFSEAVPSPGVTGVEIRGVTVSSWSCDSNKVKSAAVYLAGTDNLVAPIPSSFGAAITPNTVPINGQSAVGFTVTQNTTTIRNFNIQGFSSTAPTATSGVGIRVSNVTNAVIEANNFNGGNGTAGATTSTFGTFGIYLDRATSASVVSNTFGDARDLGSIVSGVGGVAIHAVDVTNTPSAIGPNTIGALAPSAYLTAALGTAGANGIGGRNTIRNCERVGIQIGGGGASNIAAANSGDAGAFTTIQYNTIQGMRDSRGGTASNALGGLFINPSAGTVRVSNNRIGDTTVAGVGSRLLAGDNKVDIILGANAGYTFDPASGSDTIRSIGQLIDGSDVTVLDSAGSRGAGLRTFFNAVTLNTFSHAAILTNDATKPYDFTTAMTRTQPVLSRNNAVGTTVTGEPSTRIYRRIATPMSAIGPQTFAAGSTTFTNVIEFRENAAWVPVSGGGTANQYYAENLSLPSTTGIQNFMLLGPKPANALNNTSAHIISSTGPGTGTAITANGVENKYIRGGIVMHAIGNGLYGSVDAGAANKGDVYLQRTAIGTDAGFVQFAYHTTTFGSQALVSGTGVETTGNNSNTDKPTIIKAGLNDADDDTKSPTGANSRRTGVFVAGNGTAFTKPTEPVTGLGVDGLTAFPNPSNGGTVTVQFNVPVDAMVRIALYDALGRKVTDLKEGSLNVGVYNTEFDVNNLPSGTYTVRMEYDYSVKTVQVHVIK